MRTRLYSRRESGDWGPEVVGGSFVWRSGDGMASIGAAAALLRYFPVHESHFGNHERYNGTFECLRINGIVLSVP
jgi:hypothetical protein